jgi:hypothetical protein
MPDTIARRYIAAVVCAAAFLLAACESGPKIRTNTNPTADFSRYRTFAFFKPLGTDRGEYSSLLSQYLKSATQRELEARGYVYSETSPDLLVNFGARVEQKTQVTTTPTAGVGFYGGWPAYETDVRQYDQGTLNVDLIDPKIRQLVWEGVAIGRVTGKHRDNPQPVVNQVITEIFTGFPYTAAR